MPCRSPITVGIAVATIVLSSAARNMPAIAAGGGEHDAALREPRRVRGRVRPSSRPMYRVQRGTEHTREVADALLDRSFGAVEVLDEQPPEEGGDARRSRRPTSASGARSVPSRSVWCQRSRHSASSAAPTSRRVGVAEDRLALHEAQEVVVVDEPGELAAGLLDDQSIDRRGVGRRPRARARSARR